MTLLIVGFDFLLGQMIGTLLQGVSESGLNYSKTFFCRLMRSTSGNWYINSLPQNVQTLQPCNHTWYLWQILAIE